MLSVDARVAFAPEATYRQLVAQEAPSSGWRALGRPALVLLLIAVILPIMAVREITASLVLTSAAAWSVVVAIQIAIAVVVIASAPARKVGFGRALELWFAGHVPYSAWILLLPFVTSIPGVQALDAMAVTVLVPIIWTTFIVTAFCRAVLGATPAGARKRAALQQTMALTTIVVLALWAAGGVDAVVSYTMRLLGRY